MDFMIPRSVRIAIGLAALSVVCSSVDLAHGSLFGVGSVSGHLELGQIDPQTGATTLIGPITGIELASSDGRLYSLDPFQVSEVPRRDGQFIRVDPTTGATLEKVGPPLVDHTVFGAIGMAIRSDHTVFFSLTPNLDGNSGELFDCGLFEECLSVAGLFPEGMDGLAFNATDVLYGLTRRMAGDEPPTDINLYILDPGGGQTLIGSTGIFGGSDGTLPSGLSFDPETDALFAGIGSSLYTIDVQTGGATLVGRTAFGEIFGLAFLTPVPEPEIRVLLIGAVLALVWSQHRRRWPPRRTP
jgi:hypothetical protein